MYRTAQEQMNDIFSFGMSLMFFGLMLGLTRSLISISLESEERPRLPQNKPRDYIVFGTPSQVRAAKSLISRAGLTERDVAGLTVKFGIPERLYLPGEKQYALYNTSSKTIYLKDDSTEYDFYHELSHFLDDINGRDISRHREADRFARKWGTPGKQISGTARQSELFPQAVLIEGAEPLPSEYRYLEGWVDEPLPGYSLLTLLSSVEPEAKEQKIDVVLKQLKDGVQSIQQSDRFRLFLSTMAKFYDYSIGNLILIAMQKPDATRVAGFNTWKDLGRWVKKGEKGIAILAPVMPPRPACPSCGAKLPKSVRFCPKCGASIEEMETDVTPHRFRVVYVFDLSQTEGEPLPDYLVPVLTGQANEELFARVMSLAKEQGLGVSFESRPEQNPEIKGQYSGKSIWIRPEESRAQQLKTLLHEVAHYYSEGVFQIPRRDAETIAESAAFAVGAHFGFDSGIRSFPYVALWAKDNKVLEANLAAIRKVATRIIESLEGE